MVRGTTISDEQRKACRAVVRWLQIRGKWNEDYNAEWLFSLDVDMDHSALLGRLLDGKKLLAFPPPRAYSYPWYQLAEKGHCLDLRIHFHALNDKNYVGIEQTLWEILERIDERTYIVKYREGCPRYRLFHEDLSDPESWSLRIIK